MYLVSFFIWTESFQFDSDSITALTNQSLVLDNIARYFIFSVINGNVSKVDSVTEYSTFGGILVDNHQES